MSYREDSYDQNYRNGNGYYNANNNNTPMRPSLSASSASKLAQRQRNSYPSSRYYDDPQSYRYQHEYEYEQQPYRHTYQQPIYPSPPFNKHIAHQSSTPNPYYSPRPSKSPYQTDMSRNNSTPASNSNTSLKFNSNSNPNSNPIANSGSNLATSDNKKPKLSSGRPIIKSYILNPKQNNYLSEIKKIRSDKKVMESFKLIHLKNDRNSSSSSNSSSKLTKLEPINALSNKVADPRNSSNSLFIKSYSKSYYKPNSLTYVPNYKYDKYSVGDEPSNQIVIWNFPSTISSLIIKNNFTSFGKIKEIKLIDDPLTAVPLGICLLSFDNNGDVEDSHKSAINAIKLTNKKLSIQSRLIRCGLNENNKLYSIIYEKTLDARKEKQRQRQEEDFLKQKQKQLEKIKELRITKQKQYEKLQQEYDNQLKKKELSNPISSTVKPILKLSAHDKHILPLSTCPLPPRFDKYILNRPFIFISDKYVTTSLVNSSDIRRLLINYAVERILTHRSGFYVIFQDINKAIECFDKEDGRRFKDFVVYMTVYIPDDKMKDTRVGTMGAISKAKEIIRRELSAYLLKDLREKVAGKLILDVLNSDEMVAKAKEVKIRREKEKSFSSNNNNLSSAPITTVRVIKKVDLGIFKRRERKTFIPISHALNKDAEESDDYDSEDGKKKHKFDDDEDDDDVRYNIKHKKKKLSADKSSTESDDDDDDDDEIKNEKENIVSSMSEATTPEFDDKIRREDEKVKTEVKTEIKSKKQIETEEEETETEEEIQEAESSHLNDIYKPAIGKSTPVYTDHFETFKPTLDTLREFIKDDEDFDILKKICKEKALICEPVKDINYWAWKHLECKKVNDELTHNNEEETEDSETFDFAQEIIDNDELKSKTGSFRTDGYHKIPDKLKREYLLHRRKLHNKINPVKHEEDTELSNNITTTSHNNIQSSRVNRANNRRFAADISAQKQILGVENDLLDLNQLNKRKKPVQFARSAIHNWGLYALEPIAAREMIIEYVGERIRQQVAEVREKKYLRSGIGSSYLFRIDENTVIDASKKGGIARFINHCCEPSCTAKIIKVDGNKRIVIYALRDIKKNEELTYDYKFEREFNDEERIPCLCGVSGCKGYLN